MFEAIQFSSFSDFINMGGYAFNVWTVYGLFALFLLVNLYLPWHNRKQIIREQKRRLRVNNEMQANKSSVDMPEKQTADGRISHSDNTNEFSNSVGEN